MCPYSFIQLRRCYLNTSIALDLGQLMCELSRRIAYAAQLVVDTSFMSQYIHRHDAMPVLPPHNLYRWWQCATILLLLP